VEDTTFPPAIAGVQTFAAGGVVLVSVERPTSAETEALQRDYRVERADLDLALERGAPTGYWQRDGYALITGAIPVLARAGILVGSPISFFIGRDFFLIVHFGEARPLLRFLRQFETDETLRGDVAARGTMALLPRCFGLLIDSAAAARARIDRQTAEAETAFSRREDWGELRVAELVRLRSEACLVDRLVAPLPSLAREAAELGGVSSEWERVIARATRLAELVSADRSAQDGLLLAYVAENSARSARYLRVTLAIAALTLPVLVAVALLGFPYGNPLATVPAPSTIALAVVGVTFVAAVYLSRRNGII